MVDVSTTSTTTPAYPISAVRARNSESAAPSQAAHAQRTNPAVADTKANNTKANGGPINLAAPVARGNLSNSTLKDLILAAQGASQGSPSSSKPPSLPPAFQKIGDSLTTEAPKSTVITQSGPEGGSSTVLASISTNVDGSGSSVVFFAGSGQTQMFNFASASPDGSSPGGMGKDAAASFAINASPRGQAFTERLVDIAA